MKRWYVIQTNPREEERADYYIQNEGIETYLPRMEVCTQRRFRTTMAKKPLFPNYLFGHFDVESDLYKVRWARGVKKILMESIDPVPLADEVVESIRAMEQKDGVIRKTSLKRYDRVVIRKGPMKDLVGIFQEWTNDQGRVLVLLNLLNYSAKVELHHSMVEKIANSK